MKYIVTLLLLISVAYGQTFPPSKDSLKIEYRDSVAIKETTITTKIPVITYKDSTYTTMYSVWYKLPVVTYSPVQVPPVVVPPVDTTTPNAGYSLVFQSGFDKLSDITTNNGQYGDGKISTTVYKTGPGSFYSIPQNVSSGIRSEVQYTYDYQLVSEGAIEYDVMYEFVSQSNCHSVQWHPNTSGASASPGLWHIGGKFAVVRYRAGGNDQQKKAANGGALMTIPKGRWLHMRWEFKFAQSQAYCRLYIDGVLYYDLKPSATSWLGDGSGQYFKLGFNGFGTDSYQSRIYYDNLKMYKKN